MEFNRNQFFMLGLVLLLLGIQLRVIEGYVLNEKVSHFLAERSKPALAEAHSTMRSFLPAIGPPARKTIHTPPWLGWALMSVGSVLVLHAFAMNKPNMGGG